jgi:hypothetical protein
MDGKLEGNMSDIYFSRFKSSWHRYRFCNSRHLRFFHRASEMSQIAKYLMISETGSLVVNQTYHFYWMYRLLVYLLTYFIAILQWSIGHPSSASIDGGFWLELVVRQMMFSRIPPKQCASRWLWGVHVIFFLASYSLCGLYILCQGFKE